MKNSIKKILLLLIIGIGSNNLIAQIQTDSTKKQLTQNQKLHLMAYRYLNGINTNVNYNYAKSIYKALASKQDASAMNALGMMYKQGLGVTQSNDSARYYFEQGAILHNSKSLLNLGLIYKNGDGVTQDFIKSFEYFKKALDQGNKGAYYALGYYYYKGLGVEQDYVKANKYFKAGADAGIPPCIYMNGYSYLKGYGMLQDTVIGKQLIAKAAEKGYHRAINFIVDGKIAEALPKASKIDTANTKGANDNSFAPQKLSIKERHLKDKLGKTKIDGIWTGKLISYDWSGNKIDAEQKLQVCLSSDGNTLSGTWTQNDSITIRIDGSKTDSVWVFTNSKYEKENRRSWEIKQGSFNLVQSSDKNYLKGSVTLNNLTTNEPSKPAYIVLEQIKNAKGITSIADDGSTINVSPNPFTQEINIKLSLIQSQTGSIEIHNQIGEKVYSSGGISFSTGVTNKQITLNLIKGTYILYFNGKQTKLSLLILKK